MNRNGYFCFKLYSIGKKNKIIVGFQRSGRPRDTAKHHTIHLKEFATIENLPFHEIDIKELNPMLCAAFIVVNESDMKVYRDALKPQRGELAQKAI